MKILKTTFLLLASFAFLSCEKEAVNVKVPQIEPKLVVQSYISPQDTLLVVHVSKSNPVFGRKSNSYGPNINNVRNASVTMTDGNNSVTFEYSLVSINIYTGEYDSAYIADPALFPIEAGKTYTLNVSTPDGKAVKASCTVPSMPATVSNFKLDSVLVKDQGWGHEGEYYTHVVSFSFQDLPNESNFYRIAGEIEFTVYDPNFDKVITFYNPIYFYSEDEFLNDQRIDGKIISIENQLGYTAAHPPYTFRIKILNTDEHYYRYHLSIRNSDNENPFMEPVLIYSNIEGGLGVFSAYNSSLSEFGFE